MTNAPALQHNKKEKIYEMYCTTHTRYHLKGNKMLRYRRDTALQGGLVMLNMEGWNWEILFMDIIGLSSTTLA